MIGKKQKQKKTKQEVLVRMAEEVDPVLASSHDYIKIKITNNLQNSHHWDLPEV